MQDRKKLLVITLVSVGVLFPLALAAFWFLNPLLALPICAAAFIIFLVLTTGVTRHRRDRFIDAQTKAAQTGDYATLAALTDRPHRW